MRFKNKSKYLLVLCLTICFMCIATGCTRNDNSGNPSGDMAGTATEAPSPNPTMEPSDTNNMHNTDATNDGLLDDTTNTVGDVIDDAGNTVGNVTDDVVDGVGDMVDDITGTNDTGSTTSTTGNGTR